MQGLSSIISFFCNNFNKFNDPISTNVRLYLSHIIEITLKSHFWHENLRFCLYLRSVFMGVIKLRLFRVNM